MSFSVAGDPELYWLNKYKNDDEETAKSEFFYYSTLVFPHANVFVE